MSRGRTAVRGAVTLLVAAGLLAVLRPWTIVPLDAPKPRVFDAKTYVDGVWPARVIDEAAKAAVPLATLFAATPSVSSPSTAPPPRRAVFVAGTARVTKVDLRSRVGLADLALADVAGGPRVALQVGPVIRGTALRDALGFVHFSDFENQIQFAEVASALNDRVLAAVLAGADPAGLEGQTVQILGAVTVGDDAEPREITPVTLTIETRASHDGRH